MGPPSPSLARAALTQFSTVHHRAVVTRSVTGPCDGVATSQPVECVVVATSGSTASWACIETAWCHGGAWQVPRPGCSAAVTRQPPAPAGVFIFWRKSASHFSKCHNWVKNDWWERPRQDRTGPGAQGARRQATPLASHACNMRQAMAKPTVSVPSLRGPPDNASACRARPHHTATTPCLAHCARNALLCKVCEKELAKKVVL